MIDGMAVFISVTTNPFEETFAGEQFNADANVRRPLRGIQVKKDRYAVLRVLTATGEEIPLFDSSAQTRGNVGTSSSYSNFILQQLDESRVEKQQIVETFGEDYIFFFGERPRIIQATGVLLNTADFNWKYEFWENYERYLRGTRLVEQNARIYLHYDDVVIEGYILQAATHDDASAPYHVPFNFQMFVTNYAVLTQAGSVYFQDVLGEVTDTVTNDVISGAAGQGLAPLPAGNVVASGVQRSGGLAGFLASAAEFVTDATFSVQNTLENIKNTFYGRSLVFPAEGLTVYQAPIQNQAVMKPAPTNRPIYEMTDEYVQASPTQPSYDSAELARVNSELELRTPQALESAARAELKKYGIDTTRREPSYLLLGRGAFAGLQAFGSFGIRQVDGVLNRIP